MKVGYPTIPPGISKIKIGHFTRNAAGTQSITGVGFVPKVVILLAYETTGAYETWSNGFDNGVRHYCMFKRGYLEVMSDVNAYSIDLVIDASNAIYGYISSMDADGFTITWAILGSAFASVTYLALR